MSATQMETTSNCKKSKNNEGTKYFILILVHHIMYTKITPLYTKKKTFAHPYAPSKRCFVTSAASCKSVRQ